MYLNYPEDGPKVYDNIYLNRQGRVHGTVNARQNNLDARYTRGITTSGHWSKYTNKASPNIILLGHRIRDPKRGGLIHKHAQHNTYTLYVPTLHSRKRENALRSAPRFSLFFALCLCPLEFPLSLPFPRCGLRPSAGLSLLPYT